jgi:predicted ATP-grasp superfamily ATP-dependent carboligase
MASPQRPPAIVCSASDAAALTVTQSLGSAGVPVITLSNTLHTPAAYSRYTIKRHRTPSGPGGSDTRENTEEPDALLDYLLDHVERGVLIPGSDNNVRFLSCHKQTLLDAGFKLCIPDEDVLTRALNKSDLALYCAEHGFPCPGTIVLRSAADLERVADTLQFPVVLKGVYLKNHLMIESKEDLVAGYKRYLARCKGRTTRIEGVAQEWIPGPNENFGKLYVFFDRDGRLVATHQLRRLRVHIRKDGSQGDTLVAKTEKIPAMEAQWTPLFHKLGWVGMASTECKYDPRDGLYKMIEINPRPWAIMKVSVDAGVDIPNLYYRCALGLPVDSQSDFECERFYIRLLWGLNGIPEPVAMLGMLKNRRISIREVLSLYGRLALNAHRLSIDVGRLKDPVPTLVAAYHFGLRQLGQLL